MINHYSSRWYRSIETAIFALLACNTAYYIFVGTRGEALDSGAWLVLLLLFALEARSGEGFRDTGVAGAVRFARIAAAATVGMAAIQYIRDAEWLNATNIGLWIAVVVLLETELRHPEIIAHRRKWTASIALVLYSGLLLLVLVWLWQEAWLDAFDAALWLIAFAMIEMDVWGISGTRTPLPVSSGSADQAVMSGCGKS